MMNFKIIAKLGSVNLLLNEAAGNASIDFTTIYTCERFFCFMPGELLHEGLEERRAGEDMISRLKNTLTRSQDLPAIVNLVYRS